MNLSAVFMNNSGFGLTWKLLLYRVSRESAEKHSDAGEEI